MKAVAVEGFGERPRLMDLPDPEPGPGEVLVSVEAASINPLDMAVARGMLEGQMTHEFPLVLGFDAAGRVEARGSDAARFEVGEPVFGQLWGTTIGRGTFARYVAVAERPAYGAMAPIPEGVSMGHAAALPTAGMTALGALEATGCGRDRTLLIVGTTGGVGSLATQLAAATGIRVVATARADARDWIRGLGAAETVDYAERGLGDALEATHPEGVDALLDLVGDQRLFATAARHVRDGGTAVSIAFGAPEELTAQDRITASNYVSGQKKPALLERVGRDLAGGRIAIPIQEEVALDQAPGALARIQSGGSRGKTVVRI